MNTFKILAADIGGTNARFAEVEISGLADISMSDPVVFPTWSDAIDSFDMLLDHYAANRPAGSLAIEEFDALGIAVAGAVNGQRGTLPNIAWDIDLSVSKPVRKAFLLNDFFAQAHAYLEPDIFERLHLVRPGPGTGPGSIAIVGAGTGLGHAVLKRFKGERVVVGSEAGHHSFSFHSKREREIETDLLGWKGKSWLTGDDVVSGSGAALIHESLAGSSLSPALALADDMKDSQTCKYFSRFYARA
jgi:glucokinase